MFIKLCCEFVGIQILNTSTYTLCI